MLVEIHYVDDTTEKLVKGPTLQLFFSYFFPSIIYKKKKNKKNCYDVETFI